jgi:hypothetical protein
MQLLKANEDLCELRGQLNALKPQLAGLASSHAVNQEELVLHCV